MIRRKVLLVFGWLAVMDILPTLIWSATLLTSTDGPPGSPPWFSVLWTLASMPAVWLHLPATPGSWLVEAMLSLFLALLVPWTMFTLAARERRRNQAAKPA